MRLGQEGRTVTKGEKIVVPPRTPHEVRNLGEEDAVFILEVRPALNLESGIEAIVQLSRQGKTNKKGLPKNPWQAAVMAEEHLDETALAGIPVPVQRAVVRPRSQPSVGRWVTGPDHSELAEWTSRPLRRVTRLESTRPS
jgi:hypothetical protein